MFAKLETNIETITPKKAKQWLALNDNNRAVSKRTVDRYAEAINAGEWQLNGEAIKIARDGRLLDGQHRLHAVVNADKPIKSVVIKGLQDGAFLTLDTGKKRNASDVLSIEGYVNTTTLAGILNMIDGWVSKNAQKLGKSATVSNTRAVELAKDHPEAQKAAAVAGQKTIKRLLAPSVSGFCYWLFSRDDAAKADEFFEKLASGADLKAKDPIHILRERLFEIKTSEMKPTREYYLRLVFMAWRAFKEGRTITHLRAGKASTSIFDIL